MWRCMNCGLEDNCDFYPPECDCGCENSWFKRVGHNTKASIVRAVDCNADAIKRITAENSDLNEMLGGGWPLGFSILMWGQPGHGKSRLAYRWCSKVAPGLILGLENGPAPRCYSLMKDILESSGGISENIHFSNDPHNWEKYAHKHAIKSLVVDSLNAFCNVTHDDPITATQKFAFWAARYQGVVWLISHATKGNDALGLNQLQHWPDATIIVKRTPNNTSRVFIRKSRFCAPGFCELPIVKGGEVIEEESAPEETVELLPYGGIE